MAKAFQIPMDAYERSMEDINEGLKELDIHRDKYRKRKKILEEVRRNLDQSK